MSEIQYKDEWVPLSDVQWMNIVNHDQAWLGYHKEDAVHEAVKMTEAKCKENNVSEAAALEQSITSLESHNRELLVVIAAKDEVKWVVNDLGELGVCVNGRYLFLYKGDNLEYGAEEDSVCDGVVLHDDGTPMMVRMVGKREFGETCSPVRWVENGRREDRYTEELVFTPGLSYGSPEDGKWKPLPAALQKKEGK